MELTIEYASRTQLVAIGSHVVVRIVDGHVAEIHDFERLEAAIAAKLGDGRLFGVLQVSWHGTPMPAPPVLRYTAKLMDSYAERSCVVVALLGLGFWSATLTGALAGFAGLLRGSRIEITTSMQAASEALGRELIGLNPDELVGACEELYDHMRSLR